MANLKDTNVFGSIKSNSINLIDTGYYLRRIYTQVNTTYSSFSTSWTLGVTFSNTTNFKPGSLIKITYYMPMRNDSGSWGGGYIEPQVTFDNSTWQSLGSSGYDAGVMHSGGGVIGSYHQFILLNPNIWSVYSFNIRFYFRAYDGTLYLNDAHELGTISSTATVMSGANGTQNNCHVIIEEYAPIIAA